MLEQIFKEFDLSEKEAEIYLCLLEHGAKNATPLAKDLGLPRATLYGHLEKLKDAGFVIDALQNNVKVFTAEHPEKLNLLYKQKLDNMHITQQQFEKTLPELIAKAGSKNLKPRLQYFENRNALHNMLNDILLYENIEVFSFWPVQSMIAAIGEDYLTYFNIARIRKNINLKAIWPPAQSIDVKRYPFMGSGKAFLREMRIAPERINARLSYMVYEDKVMVTSSRHEGYGFILQSSDMANMLIDQFMMIWNTSKPVLHSASDGNRFLNLLEEGQE